MCEIWNDDSSAVVLSDDWIGEHDIIANPGVESKGRFVIRVPSPAVLGVCTPRAMWRPGTSSASGAPLVSGSSADASPSAYSTSHTIARLASWGCSRCKSSLEFKGHAKAGAQEGQRTLRARTPSPSSPPLRRDRLKSWRTIAQHPLRRNSLATPHKVHVGRMPTGGAATPQPAARMPRSTCSRDQRDSADLERAARGRRGRNESPFGAIAGTPLRTNVATAVATRAFGNGKTPDHQGFFWR